MMSVLVVLFTAVRDLFRRRSDLEAELLALRHQVVVLQRRLGGRRVLLHHADRFAWVLLSRLWPRWREALIVVKPETVIAWHRRGFRWYWRWKSRARRVGRPGVPRDVINLIRAMQQANPTWGAPRIHGVSPQLLERVAEACIAYHGDHVRNLKTKRVQADEVWSYVGAKQRNVKPEHAGKNYGDIWTWVALDADSKLAISWFVGGRDAGAAYELMADCSERLAHRVQLTTDGHRAYLSAVDGAFGIGVDYAMLVKIYGENTREDQRRYSPAICIGTERTPIVGDPDPDYISTSYVERSNLSVRMHTRRFTRLTNAFSKKLENHKYAVALFYFFYNFARVHQTLRVTPAMEAGVSDHVWTIEEIVALVPEEGVVILK